RIENSGIETERPHRRDQMRGITHEKSTIVAPLRRHAMVNAVNDGIEDLHLIDGADEVNDSFAELGGGGLGDARSKRIEKEPAVRLAHQDHPLLRIGKISEKRVGADIGDIESDFDIDQQAPPD